MKVWLGSWALFCAVFLAQFAAAQPLKFCGVIHNETYNKTDTVTMTLAAASGFSGDINIGASLWGSGAFQGTRQGSQCQGGNFQLKFQGTCTGDGFHGRYQFGGGSQVGTIDVTTGACPDAPRFQIPLTPLPPPQPGPHTPLTPGQPGQTPGQPGGQPGATDQGPAPGQGPGPKTPSWPPVTQPPSPPAIPPPPAAKLCGRIHNETYDKTDTATITLDPGGGFSGYLSLGASLWGSGPFHGTRQGDHCRGATPQVTFEGTCTGDSFHGRYVFNGSQVGTIDADAGACPGAPRQPGPPQPRPAPAPPPGPPAPPFNPPPPTPPQPQIAPKLCGRVHNQTVSVSDTVTLTLNPGGGFSGNLNVGAALWGSGRFQGTRNGDQCQGATSQIKFQGTCTATSFHGTYVFNGSQVGTIDADAANCP